jgi:hypothetical protein
MAIQLSTQLYKKLVNLTRSTKNSLRVKGIAIPSKIDDNNIKIGDYVIVKNTENYYSVLDQNRSIVYDQINLPQTAIILANALAVGKKPELAIIEQDSRYGFNIFNTQNYSRLAKSLSKKGDWDRYDSILIKKESSKEKADVARNYIVRTFEKLRQDR